MPHLPAAGEVVIFDRSWYNRAGVEDVMGFCTEAQYRRFLILCPEFEHVIVDDGIFLIKFWLEVSDAEQERRFEARIKDPLRQWKLSPMDLSSRGKWYEYSRARDTMLKATDTECAPWTIVPSDDKQRARLNCIRHLLKAIPRERLRASRSSCPSARPRAPTTMWRRSRDCGLWRRGGRSNLVARIAPATCLVELLSSRDDEVADEEVYSPAFPSLDIGAKCWI